MIPLAKACCNCRLKAELRRFYWLVREFREKRAIKLVLQALLWNTIKQFGTPEWGYDDFTPLGLNADEAIPWDDCE
jgi:hypothetical protein